MSYKPSTTDICRALVTEYLTALQPYSARLSKLNGDDSITFLGEYGYEIHEAEIGKTIPSQEWRNRPNVAAMLASGRLRGVWAPDSKMIVLDLRDRGVIQGYLSIRFVNPISDEAKEKIANDLNLFALPLSLYMSFQNQISNQNRANSNSVLKVEESSHNGAVRMTQRQLQILRGMVEGKTNHDLAMELGFSVSTIRHETMAIYKELAVSDRHEAARAAISKGILLFIFSAVSSFATQNEKLMGFFA